MSDNSIFYFLSISGKSFSMLLDCPVDIRKDVTFQKVKFELHMLDEEKNRSESQGEFRLVDKSYQKILIVISNVLTTMFGLKRINYLRYYLSRY